MRPPARRAATLALGGLLGVLALVASAAAAERFGPVPFCRIGEDIAGSTVADIAFHSPNPVLIAAGAAYKLSSLAHDIGMAGLEGQDRWVGAEMIANDADARRLKEIKAAGGDLRGREAQAIKERIWSRTIWMTSPQRSPVGYTLGAVMENLPYAIARVGIDKLFEKTIGLALDKLGIAGLVERYVPLPKKVNWLLNYGGPLERIEKGAGWGKLGTRARAGAEAAADAMRDEEAKQIADYMRAHRAESLNRAAADALEGIYRDVMLAHPSAPRVVVVSSFRLEAARAAVLLPAPVIAPPAPARAAPAVAVDPVVRTIRADDAAGWRRYARPSSSDSGRVDTAPPPARTERPDPADQARWRRLHEELMRVGDGKTFAVCSNGCSSASGASWDGGRGQSLYGR